MKNVNMVIFKFLVILCLDLILLNKCNNIKLSMFLRIKKIKIRVTIGVVKKERESYDRKNYNKN